MNLSPLDIYNKEFKSSALGYNKKEVEEFLEDVGMSYEKALKKINSLEEENKKLNEELQRYENLDQKLQNTLQAIQDTVTEEKERARKEAELIISKAEDEAEKIKKEAKSDIQEEYKKLEELKEKKKLFEIRFRTFLQNHLDLLNEQKEDLKIDKDDFSKLTKKDLDKDSSKFTGSNNNDELD